MSPQPDTIPDFSGLAKLYFSRGLVPQDISRSGFRYKPGCNFNSLRRKLESKISHPPFAAGAREIKTAKVLAEMLELDA